MDCEAGLGSVVKGMRGRAVIGSDWNITVDLWAHVCTVRRYLNTVMPNVSLWTDCISFWLLIGCHHLALEWMLITSPTDTVYRLRAYQIPFTSVDIQSGSHLRHGTTAWMSSRLDLIVPGPRGCWELAGQGWTFPLGGWGKEGDRTVAVSHAGAERRDGEGTDNLTAGSQEVGSCSVIWERR